MPEAPATPAPSNTDRRTWMAVLARASSAELRTVLAAAPALPVHTRLRGPETGLVMLRGRAGGTGGTFNLGEMTVTRCTIRTACGVIGHAYVAGRDTAQAELAALIDAALQIPSLHGRISESVVTPLARAQATARQRNARRAAATRVEFFTMTNMRAG